MSHVSHVNESCLTCEWVMSHMWMSHVSHVNESCLMCEWVMRHMWKSPVVYALLSHTRKWVMSRMLMSHVSVNESRRTCSPLSHTWMSHGSHVDESCVTCERAMSHIWMSHVMCVFSYTHVNVSCLMRQRVTCLVWRSHVDESCRVCLLIYTHMNEANCISKWVKLHS